MQATRIGLYSLFCKLCNLFMYTFVSCIFYFFFARARVRACVRACVCVCVWLLSFILTNKLVHKLFSDAMNFCRKFAVRMSSCDFTERKLKAS